MQGIFGVRRMRNEYLQRWLSSLVRIWAVEGYGVPARDDV